MLLVIGIDYGFFQKIIYIIKHSRVQPSYGAEYEDPDVCEEKRKIRNATQSELQQYAVVLKDVTKYYNKFLAVNGLCLGVKRYECFGLLGINGAGKTTTFKMLTGDTPITHGDVWIKGISLKSNLKKASDPNFLYFNNSILLICIRFENSLVTVHNLMLFWTT